MNNQNPIHAESKERLALPRREFLVRSAGTAGLLLTSGLLVACGDGGDDRASNPDPSRDTSTTTPRVSFSGQVILPQISTSYAMAPFILASELGLYSRHGLEIENIESGGGEETLRAIRAAGTMGFPTILSTATAYAANVTDLRIIAGGLTYPAVDFVVRDESGIRSLDDLAGKRIAASPNPQSIITYFVRLMLDEAGLTPDDVEILNVGLPPEAWTAVKQGVADIAWTTPFGSIDQIDNDGARVLYSITEAELPAFLSNGLVATTDMLEDHRDVLTAWKDSVAEGIDYLKEDHQRAAEIYAPHVGIDVDIAKRTFDQAAHTLDITLNRTAVANAVQASRDIGALEGELNVDDLIDPI